MDCFMAMTTLQRFCDIWWQTLTEFSRETTQAYVHHSPTSTGARWSDSPRDSYLKATTTRYFLCSFVCAAMMGGAER